MVWCYIINSRQGHCSAMLLRLTTASLNASQTSVLAINLLRDTVSTYKLLQVWLINSIWHTHIVVTLLASVLSWGNKSTTPPVFPTSAVAHKLLIQDTYPAIHTITYHQNVSCSFKPRHTSGSLEVPSTRAHDGEWICSLGLKPAPSKLINISILLYTI